MKDNAIFNINTTKTMRVDEFKQIQASSIAQLGHNTGE
jgi:hypothetical protein